MAVTLDYRVAHIIKCIVWDSLPEEQSLAVVDRYAPKLLKLIEKSVKKLGSQFSTEVYDYYIDYTENKYASDLNFVHKSGSDALRCLKGCLATFGTKKFQRKLVCYIVNRDWEQD